MKICFLAPGDIEIPPVNWGAIESITWELSQELEKIGHNVLIVNEKKQEDAYEKIKSFDPDILHLHYGSHYDLMPKFDCRKIVTNYDGTFIQSRLFHDEITRKYFYDCEFILYREYERDFFLNIGISPNKIKLLPLGVRSDFFKINKNSPSKGHRSIYLGKIDLRKRQYMFQDKDLSIDFVGPLSCSIFNGEDPCYLGVWSQDEKYQNLTEYGNLVLLSVSENGNPPLVCLEAMSAGLGIVISETSNELLDTDKKFITVIPDDKIFDFDYLKSEIEKNRIYSINNRQEIIDYVSKRKWSEIAKKYHNHIQ